MPLHVRLRPPQRVRAESGIEGQEGQRREIRLHHASISLRRVYRKRTAISLGRVYRKRTEFWRRRIEMRCGGGRCHSNGLLGNEMPEQFVHFFLEGNHLLDIVRGRQLQSQRVHPCPRLQFLLVKPSKHRQQKHPSLRLHRYYLLPRDHPLKLPAESQSTYSSSL